MIGQGPSGKYFWMSVFKFVLTHTSCIKNKPLEIRPNISKFDRNVYTDSMTFIASPTYMYMYLVCKRPKGYFTNWRQYTKCIRLPCTVLIVNNFQSLSYSTLKQKKKLSQVLKVRIKSYWGAAQDISTRRGKAKNHDETNDLSYLFRLINSYSPTWLQHSNRPSDKYTGKTERKGCELVTRAKLPSTVEI